MKTLVIEILEAKEAAGARREPGRVVACVKRNGATWRPLGDRETPRDDGVRCARVALGPHDAKVILFRLLEDAEGCSWDVVIETKLEVADPVLLLAEGGLIRAPLETEGLVEWMADAVRGRIREGIGNRSIEELREGHTHPTPWWQIQFEKALGPLGIRPNVTKVSWRSEAADQLVQKRGKEDVNRALEEKIARERADRLKRGLVDEVSKVLVPTRDIPRDGHHCGACGKKISTKLDEAGACRFDGCGLPICRKCWGVDQARRCVAHASPA